MRLDEGSASTRHGCFAQTDESCASSTRSERIRARIFSSTFNGQPAIRPRSPCFGAFCVRMRFGVRQASLRLCSRSSAPLRGTDKRSADRYASASSSRCSICWAASTNAVHTTSHGCSTSRSPSCIACSSSCLPSRAASCRTGIRFTARATPSNHCASARSVRARYRVYGRRCRQSHGSRTRAVAREASLCRRSTAACFPRHDRRSPSRVPWTTRSRARRCSRCRRRERADRRSFTRRRKLGTTVRSARRTRIDYRDLGVEQLGAVYESVLDYEPAYADSRRNQILLRRGGDARKSTGSFYTPQTLTDYVVRRTLHPLVDGAPADRILQLRVVDPAMGSAAFLVSACRYLARAYERALVREGVTDEADIDDADRALFRRLVAQRCLFGVDLNPTAVQLARLSLWLATLSANKPLTFLDHHLVCGNSLIGASPIDMARQPPGPRAAAVHESLRNALVLRRRPRTLARSCRRRATLARGHPG